MVHTQINVVISVFTGQYKYLRIYFVPHQSVILLDIYNYVAGTITQFKSIIYLWGCSPFISLLPNTKT